jgi:perosamine synthetase
MLELAKELERIIRNLHGDTSGSSVIPLHAPRFTGNEKKYITEVIDSTYVSTVGEFVGRFEHSIADFTGHFNAIATVNGTAALHIALLAVGVERENEVLTQSVTFVATANAISYCGAYPIFLDIEEDTYGLSPDALECFLEQQTIVNDEGKCINKLSGRHISACIVVDSLGHPAKVKELSRICSSYNIKVVEDAAESLGSFRMDKHAGKFSDVAAISFNGNKIITCGGGGIVLSDNADVAARARHLSTTAKLPHRWEYNHDEVGFNYRMPNLNAALGLAQAEQISSYIKSKRELAEEYRSCFARDGSFKFFTEEEGSCSNYWLNSIICKTTDERDFLLEYLNTNGVMVRPIWSELHKMLPYKHCQTGPLSISHKVASLGLCLPSSVPC